MLLSQLRILQYISIKNQNHNSFIDGSMNSLGRLMHSIMQQHSESAIDVFAGDHLHVEFLVIVTAGAQFGHDARG